MNLSDWMLIGVYVVLVVMGGSLFIIRALDGVIAEIRGLRSDLGAALVDVRDEIRGLQRGDLWMTLVDVRDGIQDLRQHGLDVTLKAVRDEIRGLRRDLDDHAPEPPE